MSFKNQLNKLKENWLIMFLVILAIGFIFAGSILVNVNGGSRNAGYGAYQMDSLSNDYKMASDYMPNSTYNNDFAPDVTERKVTKNATLSLEIPYKHFTEINSKVIDIVNSTDSYLITNNVYTTKIKNIKEVYSGSYSIKVESSKLDYVLGQLKDLGTIVYFNENAFDVTGKYTNLNIEIETQKNKLKTYQQMLDSEKTNVSEKLDITDRIYNLERNIKYLQDSINNIDQKIEYSTINLNISEHSNYLTIVFVKFSQLVKLLVESVNSLFKIIFALLPWAVAFFIIFFAVRIGKRRNRNKGF